ncbi:matrixin family metalloprotease [Nocardioides litoris]|uniref:matrixin family metalloprotease n=1 Tax=Nocardioides litoris TaxID=1926648 RepID=UPI00111E87D6|nr:matrixin family metalloprotease [Nocardioides litoris]
MGWSDRRDQRQWQRELERQLDALPTYDGDAPDGGPVTPLGRGLPGPSRRERRALRQARRRAQRAHPSRGLDPYAAPRGRRAERRRTVLTVGLTLAVIGGVLAASPLGAPIRGVVGWDDRGESTTYAFLASDPISGDPTTWRSCEPIRLEVNSEGAPRGWREPFDAAVAEVADATGLDLQVVGETTDRPESDRSGTFGRARPVVVGWATPEQEPRLAGDTVGLAGPQGRGGYFVTGSVVFDGPQFAQLDGDGRRDVERAIMMHELAHLVGLDHVDDDRQLMYPETTFRTEFGNGDLEGLRRLGEGGC